MGHARPTAKPPTIDCNAFKPHQPNHRATKRPASPRSTARGIVLPIGNKSFFTSPTIARHLNQHFEDCEDGFRGYEKIIRTSQPARRPRPADNDGPSLRFLLSCVKQTKTRWQPIQLLSRNLPTKKVPEGEPNLLYSFLPCLPCLP